MSVRPRVSGPLSETASSTTSSKENGKSGQPRKRQFDLSAVTNFIKKNNEQQKKPKVADRTTKPLEAKKEEKPKIVIKVKKPIETNAKAASPETSSTIEDKLKDIKKRTPIIFDVEAEQETPAKKVRKSDSNESRRSIDESFFRSPAPQTPQPKTRFQQPPVYKGKDKRLYVAFFTNKYIFSNHFTCPSGVTVDGREFPTTEHYYMYQKALFHKDKSAAKKIIESDDPKYAKRITSKFENFDTDGWKKIQYEIMKKACLEKFRQNPVLRRELFRTANAVLVEASPTDRRWGVGLAIDNPDVADESKWRGGNLLGNLLMNVRTTLATEFGDEFEKEHDDALYNLEKRAIKC